MNVTASKVLLVVSLAAYAWMCSGHMTYSHQPATQEKKGKEITAAMVEPNLKLALVSDPFGSVPLDRSAVAGGGGGGGGLLPNDPEKKLGELSLQGVFVSFGRRVAVVNGKTLHEGEIVESTPGGPLIRARSIGMDSVVIEGGGGVLLLRLADGSKPGKAGEPGPGGPSASSSTQARRSGHSGGGGRNLASIRTEER
jgi:hypothetical protein